MIGGMVLEVTSVIEDPAYWAMYGAFFGGLMIAIFLDKDS